MFHDKAMLLIEALESGEYKQAGHKLRREDNSFCVLGVACNVFAQHHPEIAAAQKESTSFMGQNCFLPEEVMNWFGLFGCEGNRRDRRLDSLMKLNDDGMSFKDIAAMLRKEYMAY